MTASAAQRLILRGGRSAALGFLIRFGARLFFIFVAGRLFGATLFGAFAVAVAVVELAVTIGGAGLKRQIFKLLDEGSAARGPGHILLDSVALVLLAGIACAGPIMLAVTLFPDLAASNTELALFLLAPMIVGQALLDLLLAATRWTHRMRWQVWGRSVIEPYVGVVAAAAAWAAGWRETGLIVGYWAGTLAALLFAMIGVRRCLGPLGLAAWRFRPRRIVDIARQTAWPTLSDFVGALAGRLDLYLVGILLGEAPAGIYGMAQQLRTPIRQVRQSFDGLLTPIVSRTLAHGGAAQTGWATASASRLILAIQLPALAALAIVGTPLLRLIGPEFVAGYWAMLLLAAAETVQGAFGVSDLILLFRRAQRVILVTITSAAVTLVLGPLLIGLLGLSGAALAAFVAAALAAIMRRTILRREFGVEVPVLYAAVALPAAAADLGVALMVMGLPIESDALRIALAALSGLGAYLILLRLILRSRRESLSLTHFVVEPQPYPKRSAQG